MFSVNVHTAKSVSTGFGRIRQWCRVVVTPGGKRAPPTPTADGTTIVASYFAWPLCELCSLRRLDREPVTLRLLLRHGSQAAFRPFRRRELLIPASDSGVGTPQCLRRNHSEFELVEVLVKSELCTWKNLMTNTLNLPKCSARFYKAFFVASSYYSD